MLGMFGKNTWDKIDAEFREMNEYHGSLAEARAEIERLEKEVERIKQTKDMWRYGFKRVMHERDTSWNDAIDAAAQVANDYDHHEMEEVIRALKRSTQ